jgi:hypothetical protein
MPAAKDAAAPAAPRPLSGDLLIVIGYERALDCRPRMSLSGRDEIEP